MSFLQQLEHMLEQLKTTCNKKRKATEGEASGYASHKLRLRRAPASKGKLLRAFMKRWNAKELSSVWLDHVV